MDDPRVVWDRAAQFNLDFRSHNLYQPALITKQNSTLVWTKPLHGFLKINFDAAWEKTKAGLGFIARDEEGFVHGGGICFMPNVINTDWVEGESLYRCLTWAKDKEWENIVFEGDSASIINRVNSNRADITVLGCKIRQCREIILSFNNCKIMWCNRVCNKVVDCLSHLSLQKNCNFFFDMDYPYEIQNFVIKDSFE